MQETRVLVETKGTTGEETISYWFDLPIDVAEFEDVYKRQVLGKRNECIALFKQLEEVATEKDKEYIQNSIKFVQEQLEK